MLTNFICSAFLSGKAPIAFDFPKSSTRQWNYLTHSWDLGLQASGHVHMPMGHEYRASGGLDSSETLWFFPGAARYPVTIYHLEEDPISGSHLHVGLTVWEAITGTEDLRTRLPFHSKLLSNGEAESKSDKHRHYNTHTVRITQSHRHSHLVDNLVNRDR
jgi:hypothetical protein